MPDSEPSSPSTGQLLYDAGWCQGSVLPEAIAVRLRPATVPEHYRQAVLITQDCNIVADNDRESHIEIAFGFRAQADQNVNEYAQGKNPRLFLTTDSCGQRMVWDVRERLSVSKAVLTTTLGMATPVGRMLDSDLREFRAWLGRRYSRPAFPDAFNDRLLTAKTVINKAIKSDAFRSIRGVYYLISERDQELSEGAPYHLRIIFCFAHNGTVGPTTLAQAELEKFAKAVAACPGIELTKYEAISDSRFPIQYLDVWECVDFDARSYGSSESAPPRG